MAVDPWTVGDFGHAIEQWRRVLNCFIRMRMFPLDNYYAHPVEGLHALIDSLTLGCDRLGAIHYFDAEVPTVFGTARTIESATCLHEEDAGLSWKHFDVRTERTEVRCARKLVISSISTIGNYEYASYWYLHQDGRIEYEMKATGIINTAACRPGHPGKFGTEVAPGIVGHIHQHVFCAPRYGSGWSQQHGHGMRHACVAAGPRQCLRTCLPDGGACAHLRT